MSDAGSTIPETEVVYRRPESLPMITRLWLTGMVAILLILWGSLGYLSAADGARGIPVGIFRIQPSLTISSRYDDNVYKTESQRLADKVLTIQPIVQFSTHWKKLSFQTSVTTNIDHYETQTNLDTNNTSLNMGLKYNASRDLTMSFDAGVDFNHDAPGAPDVGSFSTESTPRQWKHYGFEGKAQYTLHRFRTEFDLSHQIDAKQQVGNYWNKAAVTLMYALAPRTSLLTGLSWKGIVYDDAALKRDSQEKGVNVGVTWSATAKTQGDLRVGYVTKDTENSLDGNPGMVSLGGAFSWKPLARTGVSLDVGRTFAEGGLVSSYYKTTGGALGLSQQLRSFLSLKSRVGYTQNVYSSGMENDIWKESIGLEYAFPRWLTMNTTIGKTSQKSTQPGSGYDSNEVMISLTGGL
ncbi:MAG: outer membrane beta-barrel protein [Magnetococcales bacterium]|nr:outer membrane beta-barrel protein [Magnetococcales bacterium]